jgi:rubrerythrin
MTVPGPAFIAELATAFAAEAMAAQRYDYFARIAEIEGRTEAAMLFGRLAESVACVAQGHMDVLRDVGEDIERPVGDTSINLASAVETGLDEADSLYPRLKAAALADGLADVASWMTTVMALKQAHLARLDQALARIVAGPPRGECVPDGQ